MEKRFVTIWFPHLKTDWLSRRQPQLHQSPVVIQIPERGKMIVTDVNAMAEKSGIHPRIAVADARAIFPGLVVFDDKPDTELRLLKAIAEYCIRYSPFVAIDPPGGIILDATGCAHLWGGEQKYITAIINRFNNFGYKAKAGMGDTIGAAWAITRFGKGELIIEKGNGKEALINLSVAALRVDQNELELLYKLGLKRIGDFIDMPRSALRRRFGNLLVKRLDQAIGIEDEVVEPVQIQETFHERLACPELILTATGIEIALKRLLELLCLRLRQEQKGIRSAIFNCFRVDGKMEKISIGTNRGSYHIKHLFRLFEFKLTDLDPGLGIELFTLEAIRVEELKPIQEKLWISSCGIEDTRLTELIDRIDNKIGAGHINRYLPDEHYWPERSIKRADSLLEETAINWQIGKPRPVQLLSKPKLIEVTAPIPDYPPMLFRYKGKLHTIKKADGPERIEREWWIETGPHRDYYYVEDEEGQRYWLFRLGHYSGDKKAEWFIHGFFA